MDRRVHVCGKAKVSSTGAVAKASPKWAFKSRACGPKPSDLPVASVNDRRHEAVNVEKFWHELRGGVKV